MPTTNNFRITLDTNVCDIINNPEKRPEIIPVEDAKNLREVLRSQEIEAFISESTLFVECLSFPDKLIYLSVAGTNNPRPAPDPRRTAVFTDLATLGIKLLHAPLIGAEKFINDLDWAVDVVFPIEERQKRFNKFICNYPRHEPLKQIGFQYLTNQSPIPAGRTVVTGPNSHSVELQQDWAIAIKREWDGRDTTGQKKLRKVVGPIIGEWCDALIVGSHFAYGNNIFCTADEGKGAGANSILHHSNRENLKQEGIQIMSPSELLLAISG